MGEGKADAAAAQIGIILMGRGDQVGKLVASQIETADHHAVGGCFFRRLAVSLKLKLLTGQAVFAHVEVFRAVKADAVAAQIA